jgi:hypothetical protein
MKTKNPAGNANRALVKIAAIAKPLDNQNPTELPLKTQSEMLAARSVMRRFGISYFHAVTVCQLHGLGGTAA